MWCGIYCMCKNTSKYMMRCCVCSCHSYISALVWHCNVWSHKYRHTIVILASEVILKSNLKYLLCKFEDKFLGIWQKISHILGRGQKQSVQKLTLSFVDRQAPTTRYSKLGSEASQLLWLKSFKKSFALTLVQKLQVKLHNYSGWKAPRKASHLLLL